MKSKYEESMPVILKSIEEGYTNEEAARRAGIGERTFYDWMKMYPQFSQAVQRARKDGERNAIFRVENSLLSLANGFEYEEVMTEYESQPNTDKNSEEKFIPVIKKQRRTKKRVIPSVEAIRFYLTNKAPEVWKNRQQQEIANLDLLKNLRIDFANIPDGKHIVNREEDIAD